MKKINAIFEQVYNWFTAIYGIRLVESNVDTPTHLFNTERVHIMIDGLSSKEHPFGTLKMELKETFYGWNNAYYERPLPTTLLEFEAVLNDIKEISKKEHIEKSDNFYRYFDVAK